VRYQAGGSTRSAAEPGPEWVWSGGWQWGSENLEILQHVGDQPGKTAGQKCEGNSSEQDPGQPVKQLPAPVGKARLYAASDVDGEPGDAAYASVATVSMATLTTPWASARKPISKPTVAPPIVSGKVIGMNTIDRQAFGS
jgi:hypothetical protein